MSIRRQPLRRSLRLVTFAWMFGVVWMSGVSGAQMTDLGWMLGFSDFDFGLYTAIPFAATSAQLLAAMMIERTGLRKYQFIYFATAHRLLWLAIAAVPLVFRPGPLAIGIFMLTYLGSAVLGQMSAPSWQTWMGDLIPRRIRGRYFSIRRVWTIPIQLVAVTLAGWMLDTVTIHYPPPPVVGPAMAPQALILSAGDPMTLGTHLLAMNLAGRQADHLVKLPALTGAAFVDQQPYLLIAICVILAISSIFGVIDILLFLKMREIVSPPLVAGGGRGPVDPAEVADLSGLNPLRRGFYVATQAAGRATMVFVQTAMGPAQVMRQAFGNKLFRHYALYCAVVAFAMSVGGNYFWNYVLKNVGYSKLGANIVFQVCGAFSAMLMARSWGRLIDVWGRRPVLIIGTIGWVLGPTGWFLCPQGNMPLCYLAGAMTSLWSGMMFGAVNLAQIAIVMGYSESQGRSKFVAANAVVTAVGGFCGGLAGGQITEALAWMQDSPIHVGPMLWNNYHVVFFISAMMRAASLAFLVGMPDPGARPFREVAALIRQNAGPYVRRLLPWSWIRPA